MALRLSIAAPLLVVAWLLPLPANAGIYKCVGANGDLTFSQAPCPEKDSTVTVVHSSGAANVEPADCEDARVFALATAQQMKSGTESSTIFDSYGGLSALSKGSVSLISYVFQFRTNNDVSATRVSALATAKCQARAFGNVSCEQLPAAFTHRPGGCAVDEEEGDSSTLNAAVAAGAPTQQTHLQPFVQTNTHNSVSDVSSTSQARRRETKAAEEKQRLECRDRYKTAIENINEIMRSGYTSSQGETNKKKRRALEEKMREC